MARDRDRAYGVRADLSELDTYLDTLGSKILPSVAASSLTSTARGARRGSIGKITARLTLAAADVKKRLRVRRATPAKLVATIFVNKRDVPFHSLKPRQVGKQKRNRRPAGKQGGKRGGVNVRGRGLVERAWIGRPKSGSKDVVLQRKSEARDAKLQVPKVKWAPALDIIARETEGAGSEWRADFLAKLRDALERRGSFREAGFVQGYGED
jgi:hypothetical protein